MAPVAPMIIKKVS